MSTVREIAEKINKSNAICSMELFRTCNTDYISHAELRQLTAHVLASTEPLGDERLRDLISSECTTCGEKALIAEIRRLQAELKDFGRQRSELLQGWHNTESDLRAQLYRANLGYFEEAKENKDLRAKLQAAQQEVERLANLFLCAETITPEGELGVTPETVRRELKSLQQLADERGRELSVAQYERDLVIDAGNERGREVERLRNVIGDAISALTPMNTRHVRWPSGRCSAECPACPQEKAREILSGASAASGQETDINTPLRMHIAHKLMRAWNSGTDGFDSSVVMTVNRWIDGGMEGPIPWPDSPFFADWAGRNGYSNIGGFVGFRFQVDALTTPAATPPTKPSFRQTLRAHGIPPLSEERQAKNLRAEVGIDPTPPEQELCGDCPPIGYPNDSTRCIPCPRRPAATPPAQPLGQRLRQISDAALASGTPTLSADEIHARLNDPPAHAYTSTACQHGPLPEGLQVLRCSLRLLLSRD